MVKKLPVLLFLAFAFSVPILKSQSPVEVSFASDSSPSTVSIDTSVSADVNTFPAGKDNSILILEQSAYKFRLNTLLRGLSGMMVLILIAWLFSSNRKGISWKIVGYGLLLQILLAIGVLHVPLVQAIFEFMGKIFVKILDFTAEGTKYLFKSYRSGVIEAPLQTFAINILPTIIFFSALSSLLYYFGIIQKVVWVLAWLLSRTLKLSGSESLATAANIFMGQIEAPLLVKAYLEKMNKSEILLVMSAGMATMAGGVLAVYIGFLGGDDPVQRLIFAKHLIAASVMAAPGVVVISKILYPQTEDINREIKVSSDKTGKNLLESISIGTGEGLRLAVNVGAMLLVFIAFLALINFVLLKLGAWTDLNQWIFRVTDGRYSDLSLQLILGYTLSPLMWLLGVDVHDITLVGSLLGEKLIMTEFIGYISLTDMKASGLFSDPKSVIMATYILCGFANFASVGMQIAGIGALAPGQKSLLARFGMRALLSGTLASLLSATIIGVILS